VFEPATQIVERTQVIEPPELSMVYRLTEGANPALEKAYKTYLKTGVAKNIEGEGFVQFAYGLNQPMVAASPFELTVISLEPGENVTNVSSGDPMRWSYSLAYSGKESNRQAQVMVKPSLENISTDLVITTDKRLYTIKIVSTANGQYIRNVRFWYPLDIQAQWKQYNVEAAKSIAQFSQTTVAAMPNVNLAQMNFDYRVVTKWFHRPRWKPTRVFDDGVHTYIQFPADMANRDMPVLLIKNNGEQELVNYRAKAPYFVVDKLFKEAVLVMGVGRSQQEVVLINTHG
jgi:type IV secretion system protein VirB9